VQQAVAQLDYPAITEESAAETFTEKKRSFRLLVIRERGLAIRHGESPQRAAGSVNG
jgi:hypothetical protein